MRCVHTDCINNVGDWKQKTKNTFEKCVQNMRGRTDASVFIPICCEHYSSVDCGDYSEKLYTGSLIRGYCKLVCESFWNKTSRASQLFPARTKSTLTIINNIICSSDNLPVSLQFIIVVGGPPAFKVDSIINGGRLSLSTVSNFELFSSRWKETIKFEILRASRPKAKCKRLL